MKSNILPVWGNGNVFLKYEGNNIRLAQYRIKKHKTRLFSHQFDGFTENLMFNFRLHNEIEIAVALASNNVYLYSNGWIKSEDSLCNITEILVDNDYTFIKGVISFTNIIDVNNRYIEVYHFDFLLRTNDILLNHLQSENLDITDFRNNLN